MIRWFRRAKRRLADYVYNQSVDIKDRAFVVFSAAVLVALFAAVPFGLIMHEPMTATVSTLFGALFFSLYVIIAYKRNMIKKAKILLSIIVVFVFLPTMFFTNGGVLGGTPVWLLLGTIYIALILEGTI